tara:strand:+ start:375 stop:1541 length:1167 start_codon:yes stop_codon:yes gene_type:complete
MKIKFKIKFLSKVEKDYFENLDELEQKKIIKKMYKLEKIKENTTPFRFKILSLYTTDYNKNILLDLYNNFCNLDKSTQEYFKYKIYFDNINNVPFNNYSILNIKNINNYLLECKEILNKEFYGHETIKNYLLQILCQYYTNPESNNILGFFGPPGVGKTTLAYIISKILKKPLEIINLCGAQDSSYLEGHSFTYEGSKPGKIISTLIKHKTMNPIILFDEVDKISKTEKGYELEKLLINIADNSQNNNFIDKYFMEVTFDLSQIFFIFSYNDRNLIDPILYDRICEIEFKYYNTDDKIELSQNYIIPKLLKNYSFKIDDLKFDKSAILYLINKYSKKNEGIRTLKNIYNNIISKVHIVFITNDNNIIKTLDNIVFPLILTKDNIKLFI